jgi:5-formyltetrahydrofolate cyclo-ligase
MNKEQLCKEMLAIRDAIPSDEKKELDRRIMRHVIEWPVYRKAKSIFCYVSYKSEVDTLPLIIRILEDGKTLTVSRVNPRTRTMQAVHLDTVFGIG